MFEILDAYRHGLGAGLDEDAALLFQGKVGTVLGKNYLWIYDSSHWDASAKQFIKVAKNEKPLTF